MQNEIDSLTTDYNDKYSCKIQLCYIIKSKYTDVLNPDQENTRYYFMWSDVVGQSKFKNVKMSYKTDELYEIQDYSEEKVNKIFSNQVSLWQIEGEERNSEKIYNWYNLSE